MDIDTAYVLMIHYYQIIDLISNALIFGLQKLGVDID